MLRIFRRRLTPHADIFDRSCRIGMFFNSSSFGMRRLFAHGGAFFSMHFFLADLAQMA